MREIILLFSGLFLFIFCFIIPTIFSKNILKIKFMQRNYFLNFFCLFFIYISIFSGYFYIISSIGSYFEKIFYFTFFLSVFFSLLFSYLNFKSIKSSFGTFFNFQFFSLIYSFFFVLLFISFIKNFFVPFKISGESMANTYHNEDLVLVDKIDNNLKRGEVVIFNLSDGFYLKRIIGQPNDKIMIDSGKVFIQFLGKGDFKEIKEDYLSLENKNNTFGGEGKIFVVPEKTYFLLGDNRNHSTDSRHCFGDCNLRDEFISEEKIVGKVFIDLGKINL